MLSIKVSFLEHLSRKGVEWSGSGGAAKGSHRKLTILFLNIHSDHLSGEKKICVPNIDDKLLAITSLQSETILLLNL